MTTPSLQPGDRVQTRLPGAHTRYLMEVTAIRKLAAKPWRECYTLITDTVDDSTFSWWMPEPFLIKA